MAQFYPFPRLPIELRLKIWRLSGPEPCVVTQAECIKGYRPLHTIMESRPTPAVLHACRESREEFMNSNNAPIAASVERSQYRPFFEDKRGKKVFFSFEVDALHLMDFKAAEPLVRKQLRYLVIGPYLPPRNTPLSKLLTSGGLKCTTKIDEAKKFRYPNFYYITCFKNLQKLIMPISPPLALLYKHYVERRIVAVNIRQPKYKVPAVVYKQLVM